ncbi:hypothetical protein ACOSQ2_018334 [Xanthoceras sorbifolium]
MSFWWRFVWQLDIPPKVRLFLWCVCHGWIPSAGNLARRHIASSAVCMLCKTGWESTFHALWGCCSLKPARKFLPTFAALPSSLYGMFIDFLVLCKASLSTADFGLFCIRIWRIWYVRNNCLFAGKVLSVAEVDPWALPFQADYVLANSAVSAARAPGLPSLRWLAPSPGWFKINSDAAVDSLRKKVGLGVIILVVAEAMAILCGMQIASELGTLPVVVESDASSMVSMILVESPPLSDAGLIIADILQLKFSLSISQFRFASRSCNKVAHKLAKFGLSVFDFLVWVEDFPPCVEELIQSESLL